MFSFKKLLSKISKKIYWKSHVATESEAIIKAERNEHPHNPKHHLKEFLPKKTKKNKF